MVAPQDREGSIDRDRLMTIDEVAQSLGVTKTTIRRRIKRGEVRAVKKMGPYGEQYYVPESEVKTIREVTDVLPVTRQISLPTFAETHEQAITATNEPFRREVLNRMEDLRRELTALKERDASEELKKDIAALHGEIAAIKQLTLDYQSQLEMLVAISLPQPENEPPSRWQRFKNWLRSTPKEKEPAEKEETPVKRL